MSTEEQRDAIGEWQESEAGTQGECFHCEEVIPALSRDDRCQRQRRFKGRAVGAPFWVNCCASCRLVKVSRF